MKINRNLGSLYCFNFLHDSVIKVLCESPFIILYISAGSVTCFNEALWIGSSFFTLPMLESRAYQIGHKLLAFTVLVQFIVVGSISCAIGSLDMLDKFKKGEDTVVSASMLTSMLCFFAVIPFVQIPLLKAVYGKLKDTIAQSKTV